jgi:DnaJ family protein C protein 28
MTPDEKELYSKSSNAGDGRPPRDTQDNPAAEPDDASQAAAYRLRMRTDLQNLIEDLIEDGRQRGVFDNLPGHGKPLELDRNPHEGSMELANRLLKDNQLRPAWISRRLLVLEKIEALREEIGRTWQRYEPAFRLAQGDGQRAALTVGWDDACRKWQEEIVRINRLIDDYNLKRPGERLEIFKLRLADELQRAGAPRYLV